MPRRHTGVMRNYNAIWIGMLHWSSRQSPGITLDTMATLVPKGLLQVWECHSRSCGGLRIAT